MLSILSTALDSARRILGKRKHSEPLDGQDRPDETLSEEQQNLRKRQQSAAHCSTSNAPAWSCRAYSSRGPSLGDGGSALPLSRLGSSPLELPPPMEPSDLLVLPTDLLQTIFSELALQDRLALRASCRALAASVPYGGLHLAFPLKRVAQFSVPSLAERPAITQLTFEQTCSGRLRKRALKNLLSRLGPATGGCGKQERRFELRIIVNTVLSSVDLAWLEKALESNGLLHRAKLLDLTCVDAEMYNTLQQVPILRLKAESLSESTLEAIWGGFVKNLECIHLTHLREEEEVQMALVAADRGMLPCLKKLTLEVAGEQTIPLGCRGRHPDLSHLASLSISPHIALCVNFLRYLSSLRSDGVAMCPRLVGALEDYAARRNVLAVWFGNVEEEQHGFLEHGELVLEIEV